MPVDEGLALHDAAFAAAQALPGMPMLEVGTYCGKSAVYLGAACLEVDPPTVVFTVDHHRGSEENQAGWEHHDTTLIDPTTGRLNTLPTFLRTMREADLEGTVIGVVGLSPIVAAHWGTPLAFLFIDGGHGVEPARSDYESWTPKVVVGGTLAIHDVFPDPGRRRSSSLRADLQARARIGPLRGDERDRQPASPPPGLSLVPPFARFAALCRGQTRSNVPRTGTPVGSSSRRLPNGSST